MLGLGLAFESSRELSLLELGVVENEHASWSVQACEDLSVRVNVYERLFGPSSDWVAGTHLLAQSYYEDARKPMSRRRVNSWSASTSRTLQLRVDWDLGKR